MERTDPPPKQERRMSKLVDLADITPIHVWEGVIARRVQGDQLTLAIVELEPNQPVPEHRHPNEQNGMVIRGEVRFRVGDEERLLGPGGTWQIPGDVPHSVVTGPDGAVVIDVFAPIRADWEALPKLDREPRWP
jgi:quercetin dioxygenase-like cupin family protein